MASFTGRCLCGAATPARQGDLRFECDGGRLLRRVRLEPVLGEVYEADKSDYY
jgi:hypothetical protein